ncbi:MAG TPA: rod shape-determining protein MreC [Armatimonadota bacterium]
MAAPGRRVTLVGLCGLCLLLSVAHKQAAAVGRQSPVAAPLLAVMGPGQRLLSSLARGVKGVVLPFASRRASAAETASLRQRAGLVDGLEARLREVEAQNARLKELLGSPQEQGRPLLASVLGEGVGPWSRTLLVGRGGKDGVNPRDVVVTRQGVVGQVAKSQSPWSSVVLLLTDPESEISVLVQRTRAQGLARGTGGDTLSLLQVPKHLDVREGDSIVTTGKGGVFPAGLLVGRVTRLHRDESGTGYVASIAPAVDLGRLEEVLVLRSLHPGEASPRL